MVLILALSQKLLSIAKLYYNKLIKVWENNDFSMVSK